MVPNSITSTGAATSTATGTTTTTPPDAASIGSALATALGGGTGIDMTQLATNLASAQFLGRVSRIDSQSTQLATQVSQASQLKNDLLTLASSVGTAVRSGSLSAQPSVANPAVASASLPLGSSGASGSYSLEVSALAAPQVLDSNAFSASTATTGSGTLTFSFGTIATQGAGKVFTADTTHAPVTVTVAAGATLSDVATAINQSGAGVSAYVTSDSNGAHLVLKGTNGAANAFTVSASEATGDPGLAKLAWDPAATSTTMASAASASDAAFKLDGVARTSASNTLDNVAPGLSLKLTGTNPGAPTTVSFSDPTSSIAASMQDLTTALNSLVTEMNGDLNPVSGGLSADPGARAMRRQLSQLPGATILPNAAKGAPATLADLGLSVRKDGSFALDGTKLTAALTANATGVAAMFTTGLYGVYGTLDSLSRNLASASDPGSLAGSVSRYTARQTTLASTRASLVTQQDTLRTQLVSRFAKANTSVAASKSTLTYLQNQVAAWSNKSSN